jgi:3',5'-cyclic AMP phosphodiesterase CpdA
MGSPAGGGGASRARSGFEPSDVLIVHYSDAHIGRTLQGSGVIWQTTGHDVRALEAFSNSLDQIRRRPAAGRLMIHSGDASATGDIRELDLYMTLRENGTVLHGVKNVLPFRTGFADLLDIPGNHDFWNGSLLPNPVINRSARTSYWPGAKPWTLYVAVGRFIVFFHGLCSTSGATRVQQVLAVGDYRQADLDDLAFRVNEADHIAKRHDSRAVHVLVTHHSPSAGSRRKSGLGMNARATLQALCAQYQIAAVLSGHSHEYGLVHQAGFPVEARAATTLQKNAWPQRQQRHFWLHRLREDGETLIWTATPWVFENRKFRELDERTVTSLRNP